MSLFTMFLAHDKPPAVKAARTTVLLSALNAVTVLPILVTDAPPTLKLAGACWLNAVYLHCLHSIGKENRAGSNFFSRVSLRLDDSVLQGLSEMMDNGMRNIINGGDTVLTKLGM